LLCWEPKKFLKFSTKNEKAEGAVVEKTLLLVVREKKKKRKELLLQVRR
jgi:hypothetical protein